MKWRPPMGCSPKSVSYPEDRSYVIYRLRAAARWHDGKPVTPDDVIFSFDALKKNSPMYSAYYRHITKCEQVGERDVKFTFDGPGNRELPHDHRRTAGIAQALVGRHGRARPQARHHRDHAGDSAGLGPLPHQGIRRRSLAGAGAGHGLLGQAIFPHNVGQNNFDQIRYEFFRDDTVAREAFKADQVDWIA